jgi:predicted MFS family arabinose efflux permease
MLSVAQTASWGILYYAFVVIASPMEEEFGWSRTTLNGALSLGLLVSGLCAPFVGAAIDRGHARLVMTLGSILGAALIVAWALVREPIAFYAIWILIGVAQACTLYEPGFAVLTRALDDRAPRAITEMTLLAGFASTVFIPLTHVLVEFAGWREALLALAAILLAICVTTHLLVLNHSSVSMDRSTHAPPDRPRDATLRSALNRRPFWLLLLAFALNAAVFTAITFHILPLLAERGVDRDVAVALVATIGPMQVAGRIVVFALGARTTGATVGLVLLAAAPPVLLLPLVLPPNFGAMVIFCALYGAIHGTLTIARGNVIREIFGARSYGSISGSLSLPSSVSRAFAPAAAAVIWSIHASYVTVLWILAALSVAAFVAFWLALGARRRDETA